MAADRVTEQFRERGLAAAALHGGMTQMARTKTLEDFKEGRTPVLIATDVAARGIHVDGVDLVVHVDPPRDSKDYLHRAGRTARAGQAGIVASLILPKQETGNGTGTSWIADQRYYPDKDDPIPYVLDALADKGLAAAGIPHTA